ncbi:hypothetical protein J1N35_013851, partial [Gossypium stocksii]
MGEEEKVMKKNIGIVIKSTTNEDSESSEEVDEDKEMKMFARIFIMFMKSNKGRKFQKMDKLKLESTKEKDLIICYGCKKQGHINDEDSSDDKNQEVANLYVTAINDSK